MADRFLQLYPADTAEQARESHYASYRDFAFGWQMRTWVRIQSKSGKSKAYLYYFSHVPPGPRSAVNRAYHAAEIAYVFNNLSARNVASEAVDQRLADMMSSYWANFATSGNPNGKGLSAWPVYKEAKDTAQEFGDKVKPIANLHKPVLDAIDEYYAAQRAKK
jgi:para-nitrobenzyl esterase